MEMFLIAKRGFEVLKEKEKMNKAGEIVAKSK